MRDTAACIPVRIRVEGSIPPDWSDWFGGLCIIPDGDTTLLAGNLPDQAGLYGILNRLAGLNLNLISVERLPPSAAPRD